MVGNKEGRLTGVSVIIVIVGKEAAISGRLGLFREVFIFDFSEFHHGDL